MSNRGGGRSGGQRRGGGGGPPGGRNPNRSQRAPPQNSPAPEPQQQSPLSEENQQTASPKVSPQPEATPQPTGGKNPPAQKNNNPQPKKAPQANKPQPAKGSTPNQSKSPASPKEESTTSPVEAVESPKPVETKKPAPQQKGQAQNKPAPKGTQNQPKKEAPQQKAAAQPAKKPAAQPAKNNPTQPKKENVKAKPVAKVEDVDSEEETDPTISEATSGIFQFGQPVHGFTPMSFNFSLPAGNEAPPVEPELPSHSGPCVVTTGGVTYELEQKPAVTMEENEEGVFQSYAKLYRYDPDSSEWKERGVGDFKILKHKETKKYRILMRRDKILKICANHNVPAVELKAHPTFPETAWVYQTDGDYSDEVVKKYTFAVRFKTAEEAKKFHDVYNEARKGMGLDSIVSSPKASTQKPSTQKDSTPKPATQKTSKPSNQKAASPKDSSQKASSPKAPSIETVHKAVIEIKSDLALESKPPGSEEITLDFLYKEIMEIKSTIKSIQQDVQQLKKSSQKK